MLLTPEYGGNLQHKIPIYFSDDNISMTRRHVHIEGIMTFHQYRRIINLCSVYIFTQDGKIQMIKIN